MSGPSQAALRVYSYSVQEATHLDHGHVGPGHLLLGVLRLSAGDAYRVLADLGIELERARGFLDEMVSTPDLTEEGAIQFNRAARQALARASEVRRYLGRDRVMPEDLLLALASTPSTATELLARFGVTSSDVEARLPIPSEPVPRGATETRVSSDPGAAGGVRLPPGPPFSEWWIDFLGARRAMVTADVETALAAAVDEASHDQAGSVQVAHLLLGLLREEIGITRRALRRHDLYSSDVRAWMSEQEHSESHAADPLISADVEGVMSVALAMVPAGNRTVESSHVLLAMTYDPESSAYRLLADLTGDIDAFRTTVVRLMPGGHDGPAAVGVPA